MVFGTFVEENRRKGRRRRGRARDETASMINTAIGGAVAIKILGSI